MKIALVCLIFLAVVIKSYGLRTCAYTRYSSTLHRYVTYHYSCSSNQYCCGTRSCCTYVYARWYLWCTIVTVCVFGFIFWWYYRYRYRPRQLVVAHVQASPGVVTAGNVNVMRVPAAYPAYPPPGQVTFMPGSSSVHYAAYPPPVYTYQGPPPAYTSTTVVNQGGPVMTSTSVQ